jgi:catechol 2,3-dioxygenase-like lactoylglutathione lyase family enzyme
MGNIKILQGIDTIIIRVSDLEMSKNWYQEKLDLKPIWDDHKLKLVVFDTSSATSLTIWQTNQAIQSNLDTSTYPIFRTPDASLQIKN